MKQTINFNQFCDAFSEMGRNTNFSHDGQLALFTYLDDMAHDTGFEYNLDVIALCCEFVEYSNLKELQSDYPQIESLDELHDNTQVIEFNSGGLIIYSF